MAFSGSYQREIRLTKSSAYGLVTPSAVLTRSLRDTLSSASNYISRKENITSGADSYDLQGSLTDELGAALIFDKVHLVHFKNSSTTESGSNMVFGSAANTISLFNSTDAGIVVPPQASFTYHNEAGVSVTAGTGDLVYIAGTTGDEYELIIAGA